MPRVDVGRIVIVAACVELGNGVSVVESGSRVAVADAVTVDESGVGVTKGATGFSPPSVRNPITIAVSRNAPKSTKTTSRMTSLERPIGGNSLGSS